jgi:hypothetical protein
MSSAKAELPEAEISVEDVFHTCKTASILLLTGLEVFEASVTGAGTSSTALAPATEGN